MNLSKTRALLFAIVLGASFSAFASEQNSANWVENPYIQPLENEIEYQVLNQNNARQKHGDQTLHQLSFGKALNDRWMLEAEVAAKSVESEDLGISSLAIELKTQLTEQGEYGVDWGLLFELEHELDDELWELGVSLIMLREWRNWVGTANTSLIYETGDNVKSEFETELSTQLRYRYRASLEPGLEYHKSESTNAMGPSLSGQVKFGGGKNVFWGVAMLKSFDHNKADNIIRLNVEYEFY